MIRENQKRVNKLHNKIDEIRKDVMYLRENVTHKHTGITSKFSIILMKLTSLKMDLEKEIEENPNVTIVIEDIESFSKDSKNFEKLSEFLDGQHTKQKDKDFRIWIGTMMIILILSVIAAFRFKLI